MFAPVSYAERARRAQNIRSPIAAPPPNISPARLASNTSNASAASVTSVASTAPSSGAVSASFSATTDDSSIVFPTREPSLTPPPTVSKSQQALANVPAAAGRPPSPQLAAKALSIVAAHTAPSLGAGKAVPTVNVWSQRIERMAAARAAAAATAPTGPAQSASVESLAPPNGNGKATGDQPPSPSPGKDEVEQHDVAGTANPVSTSTSTAPASVPNSASPLAPPPPSAGPQQAAREGVSADAWPEVGKSVLAVATSTSADSLQPSDSANTGFEEGADDGQDISKGAKSNTKSKAKSKWVPIPAAELQAAADAAVAARKPAAPNNGGQRKGSRSSPGTQPGSTGTTDVNNSQANTSANNTPRSQSGRTSAAQSRAQSAQNSPRVARGRRLPLEEGLNGVISDAGPSTHSRPASQLPQHIIQYQPPPQVPYPAPHYTTPGHMPTPEAAPAPFPRHQSHPMQPAGPPPPAAHAFQVSAAPFYPHQPHMPPAGEDYAPSPGTYGYPIYAPGPYGYGAWQGPQGHGPPPGPPYRYPPPPQQQQQPAPYISLGYAGDGQVSTTAPPPPPPPPGSVPALHVDVAPPRGGEVEKGELAPSASAIALREKMMFGSIDSPLSVNGHAAGAINGVVIENGQVDVVTGREEHQGESQTGDSVKAAKEGKGKGSKGKAANATSKDRENTKEGGRQAGRAHTVVSDDGTDAIPPVQASQSMQAEIRWKFGTASSTPPVQRERVLPLSDEAENSNEQQHQPPEPQTSPIEGGLLHGSSTMPAISGANTDSLASFAAALDLRGSASFAHLPPHPHPLPQTDAVHPPVLLPAEADPDLAVKDYGFGFGAASGSGYAALAREERLAREREFEAERAREALWNVDPSAIMGDTRVPGPGDELLPGIEAGPSHAAYGLSREHGYGRGADGLPPLGRGGRRGVFGPGPGGRGYGSGERGGGYGGRRGRGANGYSRGYGRGGYPRGGGGPGVVSHRSPPFTVTPPQHLIPLSPMGEHHLPMPSGGYYPPPRQLAPYLPPPAVNVFERYAPPLQLPPANGTHVPHVSPPVPVPLSPISFPLDHTRYYLLGQLEYYLSPQNMAQDFFLRQQMDSRGWIAISLIASFNRVKQLTMDSQLVRDVLTLSSLVQVRGSMVRMGGWESFVLPDAKPSIVEDQPAPQAYQNMGAYDEPQQPYQQNYPSQHPQQQQHENSSNNGSSTAPWPVDQQTAGVPVVSPHINGHLTNTVDASATDDDEEEDEEEEVVFVMGQDVGKWSPERVSS